MEKLSRLDRMVLTTAIPLTLLAGCATTGNHQRQQTDWRESVVETGDGLTATGCAGGIDTSAARTFAGDRARHNLRRHLKGEVSKMDLYGAKVQQYHQNTDGAWCARIYYPKR